MKVPVSKRLPYGNADFYRLRMDNFVYVDKTRFIEMLENESNQSQIFIRPRRFGKSLFLSTLKYYYDINYAEEFEQLFGDLYIGQNPTALRNSYAVMNFNFSGIDTTNAETFRNSFHEKVYQAAWEFLNSHTKIFSMSEQTISQINNDENSALFLLSWAFMLSHSAGVRVFVIIDEYDHFANDLIAMGSTLDECFDKDMIIINGLIRNFYVRLKTETGNGIIHKTFITGVSSVMLGDLIGGYNIATNYSHYLRYNEMLGFTREEVNEIMNVVGLEQDKISVDMEYYYGGYLFNEYAKNKIYNPSKILYFFERILNTSELSLIDDPDLNIELKRLNRLIQNKYNRNTLIQIAKEGNVTSNVPEYFSLDSLNSDSNFISLLFYMGLLTISEDYLNQLRLVIPNYSIEQIYKEQVKQLVNGHF
ncbi:MAG: AAA family ATPase [Planctomycetaceae bacterium]|jgi:ribosomal protein S24E|nr:AAA family ATPase [Planctomycetaceae bacterium]